MELRHLKYFVAVAEELNFRYAAEVVHIAQPALRRAEQAVGTSLLQTGVLLVGAGLGISLASLYGIRKR